MATNERNLFEDWELIPAICRHASLSAESAAECLRAVMRRLAHENALVQGHAISLLEQCVDRCGRNFLLEVATDHFEHEIRRLLAVSPHAVTARLRALLHRWAQHQFSNDPALRVIPALDAALRTESELARLARAAGLLQSGVTAATTHVEAASAASAGAASNDDSMGSSGPLRWVADNSQDEAMSYPSAIAAEQEEDEVAAAFAQPQEEEAAEHIGESEEEQDRQVNREDDALQEALLTLRAEREDIERRYMLLLRVRLQLLLAMNFYRNLDDILN